MRKVLPLLVIVSFISLWVPVLPGIAVERDIEEPSIERAAELQEGIRPVDDHRTEAAPKLEERKRQTEEQRQKEFELHKKYGVRFENLRRELGLKERGWKDPEQWPRFWEDLTPDQRTRFEQLGHAFQGEWKKISGVREFPPTAHEDVQRMEGELAKQLIRTPEEIRQRELGDSERQLADRQKEMEMHEKEIRERMSKEDADRQVQEMRQMFDKETHREKEDIDRRYQERLKEPPIMFRETMPPMMHREMMPVMPERDAGQSGNIIRRAEDWEHAPFSPKRVDEIRFMMDTQDRMFNEWMTQMNLNLLQITDPAARQQQLDFMAARQQDYQTQKAEMEKLLQKYQSEQGH